MAEAPSSSIEQNCTLLISNDEMGSFDIATMREKLMNKNPEVIFDARWNTLFTLPDRERPMCESRAGG